MSSVAFVLSFVCPYTSPGAVAGGRPGGRGDVLLHALVDSVVRRAVRDRVDPPRAVALVLLDQAARAYRSASKRLFVAHAGVRRAQAETGPRASLSRIAALRALEEAQRDELDVFDAAMRLLKQWKGALDRPDPPPSAAEIVW